MVQKFRNFALDALGAFSKKSVPFAYLPPRVQDPNLAMMQTWLEQQRQIASQDAYRYSRDKQRRFEEWEIRKERAAEPILSMEPEFEEEEIERSQR
jgi:hypothetical protein